MRISLLLFFGGNTPLNLSPSLLFEPSLPKRVSWKHFSLTPVTFG